jgi:mannose-6-phosphate isomerase-like protein (cupin superfamily)
MSEEINVPAPEGKYMVDAYDNWVRAEGVPVHEALAFDLNTVTTGPWARMGVNGAVCYLTGRDDYLTLHLLDLAPGAKSEPQRHLFDATFYVVSGRGSATVETADGTMRTIEWGPRSVFAVPMNAGQDSARVAMVSDIRYLLQLYRSVDFLFANPTRFPDREGKPEHFSGKGDFVSVRPGRHMWETNFVPDVGVVALKEWAERGGGSSSLSLLLAGSMLGAHVSELPVGTYKKAHRHLPGYCVFAVSGTGYTLNWFEGDQEMTRIDWKPGVVYAPGLQVFHQHFNTGATPARYLVVQYGSVRYPMTRDKALTYDKGTDTSVKDGGGQIEYVDQHPTIHAMFLEELKKTGVTPRMDAFVKG